MAYNEAPIRVALRFTDAERNGASTGFYPAPAAYDISTWDADLATMLNAFQQMSDAGLTRYELSDPYVDPTKIPAANTGFYDDAEDKAFLEFQGEAGGIAIFEIPGPKGTVFLADDETVDKDDTTVAAFITAVLTYCVTKGSELLVKYIKGYRARKKAQKLKPGVPQV